MLAARISISSPRYYLPDEERNSSKDLFKSLAVTPSEQPLIINKLLENLSEVLAVVHIVDLRNPVE